MELFRIAGTKIFVPASQFTTKIIFVKIKIIFICEMRCVRTSGICVISFYDI